MLIFLPSLIWSIIQVLLIVQERGHLLTEPLTSLNITGDSYHLQLLNIGSWRLACENCNRSWNFSLVLFALLKYFFSFFMKISEGSKIPLIPKSLSFSPGWKCRNNLLAIILALIFEPLACMKMVNIYMPRPYICTCMKMGPGQDQTLVATCAPPLPWSSKRYSINNNFVTGEIFFLWKTFYTLNVEM